LYVLFYHQRFRYGITLAAGHPIIKYACLGGLRSTAQMISYEIALGFPLSGQVIDAGSMSMLDIVMRSAQWWFIVCSRWGGDPFHHQTIAEVNRRPLICLMRLSRSSPPATIYRIFGDEICPILHAEYLLK